MFSGLNGEHNGIVRQHGGYGQHTAGKGFTEDKHIRADVLVIARQHLSRTGEAGLYLVCQEEDVSVGAILAHGREVAVGRNLHACFALDGLHEETCHVRVLQGAGQGGGGR